MLGAVVSPAAAGPRQQSGVSLLHRGVCPLSDPAAPARAGGTEVPRSSGARRRRGGREAGGGFDGSGSSAFHSLSRFNGRGDQSRDGVIHRDKPIPEEARRKQHCELCYPRHANRSPAPGGAAGSPGSVSRRRGAMGRTATPQQPGAAEEGRGYAMGQRGCSALALCSKEEKRGFATRPGARRGSAPPRGGDGEISIAQRRRSGVGCGDPAALIPPPLSDATTLPPLAPPAKLGVLVLSAPLSPRLDASQWISMSHSNAERTGDLKIKKERVFFVHLYDSPPLYFPPLCPHGCSCGEWRRWVMWDRCSRLRGQRMGTKGLCGDGTLSQWPHATLPGAAGCRPTSTAQDFNKKHIMVSNALSGLHYGPGASLAVPCDFLSDEPYLLSERSHLNSINLSKPPRLGASQPGAGAGSTAGLCSPTAGGGSVSKPL